MTTKHCHLALLLLLLSSLSLLPSVSCFLSNPPLSATSLFFHQANNNNNNNNNKNKLSIRSRTSSSTGPYKALSQQEQQTNNDEPVTTLVSQLLDEIETIDTGKNSNNFNNDNDDNDVVSKSTSRANDLLDELIETTTTSKNTSTTPDFDALMGYYNVSYTRTARANDNPVGGKWTRSPRFWNVKRTLQHILPPINQTSSSTSSSVVAQAVNVIRLDVLGGGSIIPPIWVVLRGDVVPLSTEPLPEQTLSKTPLLPNLSNRAIRAYFDRPRIGIGKKLAFSLGPTSSVVIDTPYVDDRLRIGIGGTSGTKFVFKRIAESANDVEATEEWKWLLKKGTSSSSSSNNNKSSIITQRKLATGLALCSGLCGWAFWKSLVTTTYMYAFQKLLIWKVATGLSTLTSAMGLGMVLSSTGGIETDSDTYAKGK